jgi:hypothetical protein
MIVDMQAHNRTDDPELDTDAWQPLRTANTRLLETLHGQAMSEAAATAQLTPSAKQNDERRSRAEHDAGEKKKACDQRAYVDYRLREFGAFEQRASGLEVRRRRGG